MLDLNAAVFDAGALIFDCDGTLVDTPDLYATAWQDAFRIAGYAMTRDWYLERAGLSEQVLLDAFEAERDVRLDRDQAVKDMRSSLHHNIGKVPEITPICDIARQQLGQRPMAVASGGPASAVIASLEATGLLPLFDTVVTIEDVARPKPAPDLFLEAARRLEIEPSLCVVFEDSPQGIEAAKNAGMQAINVRDIIAA